MVLDSRPDFYKGLSVYVGAQEVDAAATPVKAEPAPEAANGTEEGAVGDTSEKKKKKKVRVTDHSSSN